MERNFDNVLEYIRCVLYQGCDDTILLCEWKKELVWFTNFEAERTVKYWNIAPEVINKMKWDKLADVLNKFIADQNDVYEWEKKIVDVFLGKDKEAEKTFYKNMEEQIENECDIDDECEQSFDIIYPYIDEYGTEWYSNNETMEQYNDRIEYEKECWEENKEERRLARCERAASEHRRHRY
jgi:hypothetical protein